MASSKSNHLPKALLPNTLPLGIMAPRNPFWGDIALYIAPLKWLMITQVGKKNQETVTSGISQVCMTFLLQMQPELPSCLSLPKQPPHLRRAFRRNPAQSRTGRGRQCPPSVKIKVNRLGSAEAGRGDEERAAVK